MKLSKKIETEARKAYIAYFDSYIKGDIDTIDSLLDDDYNQIGSAESEVFFNKQDAIKFLHDTIDQVAGQTDIRNRTINIDPLNEYLLITDLFDIYVLIDSEWTFYSKFRASTLIQKIEDQWKFIHQHSSVPDLKAQEGENIAIEKISKENLELRDAIKRRTLELEYKNKELEIETALERVRARAMAMQQSSELPLAANLLFQEIQALGMPTWSAGYCTWDEDKKGITLWMSSEGVIQPALKMPLTEDPTLIHFREAHLRGDDFFVEEVGGLALEKHYKYLRKLSGVGESLDEISEAGFPIPVFQVNHVAFFSKGFLLFITYEPVPEAHDIFKRFANLFDQTYTRFLDLKKAEAQVREAQIETALEKVRSRSMAMHKTEELQEVVREVFTQLNNLGIKAHNCGIDIFQEGSDNLNMWVATVDSDVPEIIQLPYLDNSIFNNYIKSKKSKSFLKDSHSKTSKNDFFKHAYKSWSLRNIQEEEKKIVFDAPGSSRSVFFSDNIGFMMSKLELSPFSEEEDSILIRFGKVFDQSYTRFLDLQKAEAQAREAQIELGLERVRAMAMAMQHSDELHELVGTVFTELTKLDLVLSRSLILIIDPKTKSSRWWLANPEGSSAPRNYFVQYHEHGPYLDYLNAWQEKRLKWEYILEGTAKKEWDNFLFSETELSQLPDFAKSGMQSQKHVLLTNFFNLFGGITLESQDPLSDDQFDIMLRFAKVFELTYTRFNDLQKAEAQAREAQIEAALERVRARAMAMHSSEELADTASILFEQLHALGEIPDRVGICILNEEQKFFEQWITNQEGKYLGHRVNASIEESTSMAKLYKAWKDKKDHLVLDLQGQELKQWIQFVREDLKIAVDDTKIKGRRIHNAVFFSNGMFLCTTHEPVSNEIIQLLIRFVKVFEQSYTRFLDLKNAEAQAREAQIEAALERVRAKAMAMHSTKDISDATTIVFNELTGLGVEMERCGIAILHDKSSQLEIWSTPMSPKDKKVKEVITGNVDSNFHPMAQSVYEAWRNNESYFTYTLHANEVRDYYEKLGKLPGYRFPKIAKYPDRQISNCFFFEHGNIFVYTEDDLSEEQKQLLHRFTKVFSLTYKRYLDLKNAEAQVMEAQIEAALERVRSRTMGMQRSDELQESALILFQQIKALGVDTFASGLNIWDDDKKAATAWMAGDDRIQTPFKTTTAEDIYLPIYEAEQRGESLYVLEQSGRELKAHYEYLKNIPEVKKMWQAGFSFPTYQIIHCAFFSKGYLMFISYKPVPDAHDIFKRFAAVFEQTYTRFLDLQKAEEQAREAQIETALERVRARTMAMHSSDELTEAASVLFEQSIQLDIPALRRIQIHLVRESTTEVWYTNLKGESNTSSYTVPNDGHPVVSQIMEKLEVQKNFSIEFRDTEINDLIGFLVSYGFKYQKEEGPPQDYYVINICPFKYGYLNIVTYEPFNEESFSLIERFAKVFEQTYTRFLDLQKAESQAREAQIEAALERVRSKALAMQNSGDLLEVANVLRDQMGNLDQPELESSIVHLYNDGTRTFEAWYAYRPPDNPDGKIVTGTGYISTDSSAWSKETISKYQSSDNEYTIVSKGKKLAEWYNVLSTVAPDTLDYDDNGNMIVPEILYYHYSKFSGGSLLLISNQKPSDEAKELQRRAAKVFNLAYQRFLDLQQAEIRAKEAVKQSSLDRVRAEIASMRSTEDLQRITPIVWTELITLGVPFFRCGVFIFDENEQSIQAYVSTPQGKSLGVLRLSFDSSDTNQKAVESWRKQEVYSDHWDKKQFKAWTQSMVEQGQIKAENQLQGGEVPPESLSLQFIPFTQGMLYVGSSEPLSDEQINLVKSLAEAFSVAYARYEDFKKLEDAKSHIENTLKDLKSAQSQLIQSEKMASLGELTAGIAHEIQNPLNFVNNFSEVSEELITELKEELVKGEIEEAKLISNDVIQNLQKINHHGQRASSIVKGMLEHSRSGEGVKEPTDINALADEYLRLAYHGLRAKDKSFNANFKTEFDKTLPKLNVVPQDIGRVLLNLINNAFYAVSKASGTKDGDYKPEVTVSTKLIEGNVEIRVKDNGVGIPEQVRDKIFQPFFTTKPTGSGTGLGLSLSYDIVKAHGGEIRVDSEKGEGTEFIIQLPLV